MRISFPVLRIKAIDRVLTFYETLGLQVNRKHQNERGNILYELGFKYAVDYADRPLPLPLVILHYDLNAKSQSLHSAGLFHFARLVPDRKSLASTYMALRDLGIDAAT